MSKKAILLTHEGYQDHEVIYPYYRLTEDEYEVEIMSNKRGRLYGILGTYMNGTHLTTDLDDPEIHDRLLEYDMLVIPGGVKALEYLRQEKNVLDFIAEWNRRGKVIACICHGAQLLVHNSDVLQRPSSVVLHPPLLS